LAPGAWRPPRPGTGSFGAGTVLLAALLLAAGAFLLWRLARNRTPVAVLAGTGWRLGPWPVHPADVQSRADLVRAFDHLSLLLLGSAARTWNHAEVAQRLSLAPEQAVSERQQAVGELASLYERARYAPEAEPFPAEALAAARHDLCLLAGVRPRGGKPG
jgi:hypothetical protein